MQLDNTLTRSKWTVGQKKNAKKRRKTISVSLSQAKAASD